MKSFIKNKLRENLGNTEVGNREDARWGSMMPTMPPFIDLLVQIDKDWGRSSDVYQALLHYFVDNGKSVNQVANILKSYDVYDDYQHFLGVNEQMIDGQDMNNGTQTACNTMSVSTYKEGLKLIFNAIGSPQENPQMWERIALPIKNWRDADKSIGAQVRDTGMSGDSMPDESNTWWAAIQSTICEQGPSFQ